MFEIVFWDSLHSGEKVKEPGKVFFYMVNIVKNQSSKTSYKQPKLDMLYELEAADESSLTAAF